MNAEQIKFNATEIALKHFFCNIETEEDLENLMIDYEDGNIVGRTVWQPFEDFAEDRVLQMVSELIESIVDVFTVKEPNDNNGGYTGVVYYNG